MPLSSPTSGEPIPGIASIARMAAIAASKNPRRELVAAVLAVAAGSFDQIGCGTQP